MQAICHGVLAKRAKEKYGRVLQIFGGSSQALSLRVHQNFGALQGAHR
jgi:hypothetical protein